MILQFNGGAEQPIRFLQRGAVVLNVEVSTLTRSHRGEADQARKVAMYLVKRLCDLTLQETAGHFGVESCGVVGRPVHKYG